MNDDDERHADLGPPDGQERRKPGRPAKSPEQRAKRRVVHVSVTVEQYDRLFALAQRHRLPISHAVRAIVRRALAVSSISPAISRISENTDL